ncbi:MAG: acylphosphatase [Candidatus Krumholzibacteriota bacterium]|nr:acylphosphatase [Candidatus Krumholzibacteriota bacterium]
MQEEGRIRIHIKVKGVVQGVGFRFFTKRLASDLGLEGFVRNLADGSVEAEVEGDRDRTEKFIKELGKGPPASNVAHVETESLPDGGDYRGFEIRF